MVELPVMLAPPLATVSPVNPLALVSPLLAVIRPEAVKVPLTVVRIPLLAMFTAFAVAPMFIAAADPTSNVRVLAPLDLTLKAPAAVGCIVLPTVIFAPVTVSVLEVVPPATVNPSAALARVRPFMVLLNVFAPANVCEPVDTKPSPDASAFCRYRLVPEITAPFALLV
jgi:hypothetical protein